MTWGAFFDIDPSLNFISKLIVETVMKKENLLKVLKLGCGELQTTNTAAEGIYDTSYLSNTSLGNVKSGSEYCPFYYTFSTIFRTIYKFSLI